MIRELALQEKVHVRLLPGQLLGGTVLRGTVIQKDRMPLKAPPKGHQYFFPLGSLVYLIQPDVWDEVHGNHPSIRLGEHDIEEMPLPCCTADAPFPCCTADAPFPQQE